MVTVTIRRTDLHKVSEVARLIPVSERKLYYYLEKDLVEAPAIEVGKRKYYSEQQKQRVIEQVKRLEGITNE